MTKKDIKILIIDDNADLLMAARMFLKQHFAVVHTEQNPEKIPFLMKAEDYAVILLDMNFTLDITSGREGFLWLDKIREIDPGAAVILITAYGDIHMAVKAMKHGAVDFIQKPWPNEKLRETILAAMELKVSQAKTLGDGKKSGDIRPFKCLPKGPNTPVRRRLSAILRADVKGFSGLMRKDEVSTVGALEAYRDIMQAHVEAHHGRVVDRHADSLMAEFASVLDAVQAAVEIQEEFDIQNTAVSEILPMQFRIGINLGDVIFDGDRIYGDGINVAARIESMAEGGGICISQSVYDQVRHKLPLEFADMGEHMLKNISEPVRVYRVSRHEHTPVGLSDDMIMCQSGVWNASLLHATRPSPIKGDMFRNF